MGEFPGGKAHDPGQFFPLSGHFVKEPLFQIVAADIIEILFECEGDVTTLEIFNLKDHMRDLDGGNARVNELRHALNSGNVVKLKSLVLTALDEVKAGSCSDREEKAAALRKILHRLPDFTSFYARSPLGAAMGSDSAGKAALPGAGAGMGLAVAICYLCSDLACLNREDCNLTLAVHYFLPDLA